MRIGTSESESMVRDGEEVLPQVGELRYLGILFTGEGRTERENDTGRRPRGRSRTRWRDYIAGLALGPPPDGSGRGEGRLGAPPEVVECHKPAVRVISM